jgi:hypothetical protein
VPTPYEEGEYRRWAEALATEERERRRAEAWFARAAAKANPTPAQRADAEEQRTIASRKAEIAGREDSIEYQRRIVAAFWAEQAARGDAQPADTTSGQPGAGVPEGRGHGGVPASDAMTAEAASGAKPC